MPLTLHSLIPSNSDWEFWSVQLKGGGDGIWRDVLDSGLVAEQDTPAASVDVGAGAAQISGHLVRWVATTAGPVTFPTGGSVGDLRRIDLIEYTYGLGVQLVEGTEDAAPVAPSLDADSLALAHVYCRKGMSTVLDADDASNGYLDVTIREYV